ncbi:MAG: PTS sugar transporter subunit IIA [Deltaproteobacteria bacterium]|nr:PTS sugar transporter subunit IIA [Deltaproteobacteria bacterium]
MARRHEESAARERTIGMKINEFLPDGAVAADLTAVDRTSVLRELTALLAPAINGLDPKEIVRVMEEREKLGSTGIGSGVAIPHGKVTGLKKCCSPSGGRKRGLISTALTAARRTCSFSSRRRKNPWVSI